jgi:hypothetical protein
MTISSNAAPKAGPFNGNGVQTVFPFTFHAFAKADLLVVSAVTITGIETTLVLDSDYSVTLNADQSANPGGSVTYPISGTPLLAGSTITIVSDIAYTQNTDLINMGGFYPEVIEDSLDRGVMQSKQVLEIVSRTLQVAVSTPANVDVTLPAPSASQLIGWNAAGDGLVNYAPDVSSAAGLQVRLADPTSPANGANIPAYNPAMAYTLGVGAFLNYIFGRTAAEIAAGVTPTNYQYAEGVVDRYGTNTTPGTTDMSAATQSAFNVALATFGIGRRGVPVQFLANRAYRLATPPTATATLDMVPLVVQTAGNGRAQIINAAGVGKATFDMSGISGWTLRKLLLTGNSTNPNDAIKVDDGVTQCIRWEVDDVISMMPGRGLVASDTNSGVIRNFKHWPDNGDKLLTIAQTVTLTDVDHGIYLTGSYAHDISIYDADCCPRNSFKAGMCGLKVDATGANYGLRVIGGLFQADAGTTSRGIWAQNCNDLMIEGVYHESAVIRIQACTAFSIRNTNTGATGGKLQLVANSEYGSIEGCSAQYLDINDSSCINNYIGNSWFFDPVTPITDASAVAGLPNKFENVKFFGGVIYNWGGITLNQLTYSASMTPNRYLGSAANITPTNGTAFSINAPLNPCMGARLKFKIKNTFGVLGVATWNAVFKMTAWTQPANGFSRSIEFEYDGTNWVECSRSAADVPN